MSIELKFTNLPKGLCGLQYIRADGVVCGPKTEHQWMMSLHADGYISMSRYYQGQEVESYFPQPPDQAVVALVAILNGYQPPRRLDRLDRPFGEIQPENESANAV